MTREEAIETLRANYPDACFEQLREAVDMAIEALSHDIRTETHGVCLDLVERKDVKKAFFDYHGENEPKIREMVNFIIDSVPSTEPKHDGDLISRQGTIELLSRMPIAPYAPEDDTLISQWEAIDKISDMPSVDRPIGEVKG